MPGVTVVILIIMWYFHVLIFMCFLKGTACVLCMCVCACVSECFIMLNFRIWLSVCRLGFLIGACVKILFDLSCVFCFFVLFIVNVNIGYSCKT